MFQERSKRILFLLVLVLVLVLECRISKHPATTEDENEDENEDEYGFGKPLCCLWPLHDCLLRDGRRKWIIPPTAGCRLITVTPRPPVHPVETYLTSLSEVLSTSGGTREEPHYGALETLLNEIGESLKPRVRCVSQIRDTGAGEPDFGLYTAKQSQRVADDLLMASAPPERGVVEVKGWGDDVFATANSEQVERYWRKYGLVLVTNYREFVLVARDDQGRIDRSQSFRLAESESAFRGLMAHPHKAAQELGERLVDFLRRAMLYEAPLSDPEDLAWFLASYAREARARVEAASNLPALQSLKKALEEALGMEFTGEEGERFFRATLVQTLFYGVFSSWVLWVRDHPAQDKRFDWHAASWTLHVPMVKSLFDQIATPSRLKPLGVAEVLDWAGLALNRVERREFFKRFEEERAVQYFYEPFLKAYDPELRKKYGVWFTPPEIVQYQVERVDRVLREELEIPDGLADDRVVILDPCCGTGAYLVETLKRIQRNYEARGNEPLTAYRLKQVAMTRLFGFEIMPAPFVISHMQIGLMLHRLGAPFKHEADERAGVYLTNALTGWEPPKKPKDELPLFPELMEERDAANKVKHDAPILVILGNPPYNAFAGTSPEEEGGLVEPYKEGLTTPVEKGGWGIKKFNLDDLYVRFFRIAERRIAKTGKGIVSFISNFSYLGDPSFVVMRKGFLKEFDKIWIDCMNGDSRETGKLTPDGKPDPSVFSTDQRAVGIRVGTAVCVLVRKGKREKRPTVRFQDYWGVTKRRDVLASLRMKGFEQRYKTARPSKANRYSFRPEKVSAQYRAWPLLTQICAIPPFNGPVERRNNSLIVLESERKRLSNLKIYLDAKQSDEGVKLIEPAYMKSSGEFKAPQARRSLAGRVRFEPAKITRYPFKPFDIRLAYLDADLHPLFSRPSPQLLNQRFAGNAFFITRDTADKSPEGPPFYFSPLVCDYDSISGHARHFPLMLRNGSRLSVKQEASLFDVLGEVPEVDQPVANLSAPARALLKRLRIADTDENAKSAGLLWMHALAIGYSPAYLNENADGIRQDWPRIPLPASKPTLMRSAELGRRVAALLDTEKPVEGVTAGRVSPALLVVGKIAKKGGGQLNPDAGDFDLTAGWGHAGRDGICMPGKGKYEIRKQEDKAFRGTFGDEALDVYMNGVAYWANIPQAVWDYTIGGYQVIKKWLSYREKTILGRGLTPQEAEYVTEMARRLAALVLMEPELDANYQAVKADTWPWPAESE